MAIYRCPACGGTYRDPQNNTPYFHVCPLMSPPELEAHGIPAGLDPLGVIADALKHRNDPAPTEPGVEDLGAKARALLDTVTIRRPGHRDERMPVGLRVKHGDPLPPEVLALTKDRILVTE